jgi:predicted nucleic-acid-binding Zn-ribbon protein
MALMWVATCKKCNEDSIVKRSQSGEKLLDLSNLVNPSWTMRAKCPRCGYENEFHGSDLREVHAGKLPSPPQF